MSKLLLPRRVHIPLLDRMLLTSISIPLEMLHGAFNYARLDRRRVDLSVSYCASEMQPVKTTGGLTLTPDTHFAESGSADLVIVPGLWRNPLPMISRSAGLVEWLREQYRSGATFCVAGTGVAFMAEAGLLDGQPAATHWYFLDLLRAHFPKVDFKPHHLVTRSGRIFCAGSINSVADLMVYLIGETLGEAVAHRVEQQFSHEIRKPLSQSLYSMDHSTTHRDEVVVQLQEWLASHYSEEINMATLVDRSGFCRRTLQRRFRTATGHSPMAWLKRLRMDHAAELIRQTDLTVREIAYQVGYHDPDYFSRLFNRQFQISPTDYRRSVRGKLFYLDSVNSV